jgi:nitrite reductase (NO-forming)
MVSRDPRKGRVVASHRIAASAFLLAGGFGVVAVGWALWVLVGGGTWWGPIHSFLAGTVLLAIAGATQLFTITWAAAPAPSPAVSAAQRQVTAIGVVVVLVGVATDTRWVSGAGASIVIIGLGLLALSLVGAVRRSLLRRYDLATRFYLLALGTGVVGITLGGVMSAGLAGDHLSGVRLAHGRLNLVGLVGFTIVGTLPTILPTFARHRSVSGRETLVAWWLACGAAVAMATGLYFGARAVGLGVIAAGLALLLVLAGVIGRLGRRGLQGRLAYGQVALGCLWLAVWALADGGRLVTGDINPPFAGWTAAAIVAGVGQVLLGSLAYLVAVLAGPPPRLGRNLDRTNGRPWVPLALANGAGLGLVLGIGPVAVVGITLWVVDFVVRLARLEWKEETAR